MPTFPGGSDIPQGCLPEDIVEGANDERRLHVEQQWQKYDPTGEWDWMAYLCCGISAAVTRSPSYTCSNACEKKRATPAGNSS